MAHAHKAAAWFPFDQRFRLRPARLSVEGFEPTSERIALAHAEIGDALRADPYSVELWWNLATLAAVQNDQAGRLRALQRAHEISPGDAVIAAALETVADP